MANLRQKLKNIKLEEIPSTLAEVLISTPPEDSARNQLQEFFSEQPAETIQADTKPPVIEENTVVDEILPTRVYEPPKFKWNDILIVGDSFAMHRNELTDWPRVLVNKLTHSNDKHRKIRGKGFTGCSWWSTRREIISEISYSVPKLLIITHTEMQRIPSDENFALNTATVFNEDYYSKYAVAKEDYVPKEILKAGQEYYKHLFVQDFHQWSQERWFDELDQLCERFCIPHVIHLHAFESWNKDRPIWYFRYGMTFNTPLWNISDDNKEFKKSKWKQAHTDILVPDTDLWKNLGTRNHFSVENNVKLGEQIYDAVMNYASGGKIDLNID